MKIFRYILLLSLNTLLLVSCTVNKDFSKRKYLDLKAKEILSSEKSVPNTNSVLNVATFFLDSTKLKNDNRVLPEIDSFRKDSSVNDYGKKVSSNQSIELRLFEEMTLSLPEVNPIIVDSTDVNKKAQKEEKKADRTKNPKRIIWMILRLIAGIIITTAGILWGIHILQSNKPDGSIFSQLAFVFAAIGAILIMLVASIIGLFLILSVIVP
ncbi:MAG: hypothetical protein GQ574_19470 [Crocinitomix sp.]|nr:hypothetical protein [Crocinitomix sp.]